jgi:hypothetical protein
MRNERPKNTCAVIAVFTIFTLLLIGSVAPSSTQAEEPGSAPYVKADGDAIIEPWCGLAVKGTITVPVSEIKKHRYQRI